MKKSPANNVNFLVFIFLLLSLLISSLALASTNKSLAENKVTVVFKNIEEAVTALKIQNQLELKYIKTVLNTHLVPELHAQYFSYKVLGKHIAKMSAETKEAYVTELTAQLINTYSRLLSKYNHETISVGHATLSKSEKIAAVSVSISDKERVSNAVIKLIKTNHDDWLFFDIIIEGVSLADNKHAEVNASINKHGVEETLQRLKAINQKSLISP